MFFYGSEKSRAGVELTRDPGRSECFILGIFFFGFHVVNPDPAFVPEKKSCNFPGTRHGKLIGKQMLQVPVTRLLQKGKLIHKFLFGKNYNYKALIFFKIAKNLFYKFKFLVGSGFPLIRL